MDHSSSERHRALFQRAKIECRALAQLMLQKLPEELRHVVYQYLCIEERPIPVGLSYHFRTYDRADYDQPFDDGILNHVVASRTSYIEGHPSNGHMDNGLTEVSDEDEYASDRQKAQADQDTIVLPDGRVKKDHSRGPPTGTLAL